MKTDGVPVLIRSKMYLVTCQTSMMKFYAEIVRSQKPLTIFASAIIDARQGTKFASDQVLLKPVIFASITKEYNMVT